MTDTSTADTTTTAADASQDADTQAVDAALETGAAAAAENDAPEANPNSEAARYRVQLREAQAERDQLAERVTGYQRRQCEAAVADVLEQPGDLWDLGKADPAAFFGDGDTLNETELRAAAGALLDMRPGLAKQPKAGIPRWGQHSGTPPTEGKDASWSDVLAR